MKPESLLLSSLSSLTGLTGGSLGVILLGGGLDDTDGDGLTHITDGEATKRGVDGEGLAAHGLGGFETDHSGISLLDGGGGLLSGLTGTLIDLGQELSELAGNVSSVAVQNGGITGRDLTGVVQDDDLGGEVLDTGGGVVLGVRADVSTADILDRQVLNVEADVVTGNGLLDGLVVHLDGLDLGGDTSGGEDDGHTGLEDTSLDTSDGDSTDTSNLVDVLEGQAEGLVRGALGDLEGIEGLEDAGSSVPGGVGGLLHHVVSVPARDGDEGDRLDLVTSTLQETRNLSLDLLITSLREVHRLVVHLVDGDDHLLYSKSESEQSVLLGLSSSRDTCLELTSTGSDDQDGYVGLGSTSNHVLDEITMARGINDREHELVRLELPQGDINGDTTLTLGL